MTYHRMKLKTVVRPWLMPPLSLRKLNPIKMDWSMLAMAVEVWQRQPQTALQSLGLLQEVVKQKQNNFQSNLLYTKSRSLKL